MRLANKIKAGLWKKIGLCYITVMKIKPNIWKKKNTKDTKDGLAASAGAWKGLIDCEKLKKDIYASRRIKSTRPVPKFDL